MTSHDPGMVQRADGTRGHAARGWSWPPFAPGNTMGQRHGANSPRVYEPIAREFVEWIRPHVSWWIPADEPTVWAWATAEARAHLIRVWLEDKGGELDKDGEPLGAAMQLNRLDARCESLRSKLGLDPLSRARLGRDVAATEVDLARLMAEADDEGQGS